ncbi:MAG: hypothetical protein ACREGC_03220 [Minisyncoccia bacterium]
MKNIAESPEVFEAYARIAYCMWALEKLQNELEKPVSPISKMIDAVTGYADTTWDNTKKAIIDLLSEIIESKKIVGADYTNEKIALTELLCDTIT